MRRLGILAAALLLAGCGGGGDGNGNGNGGAGTTAEPAPTTTTAPEEATPRDTVEVPTTERQLYEAVVDVYLNDFCATDAPSPDGRRDCDRLEELAEDGIEQSERAEVDAIVARLNEEIGIG